MKESAKYLFIFDHFKLTIPGMKVIGYFVIIVLLLTPGCNNSDENDIPDSGITIELKPLGDLAYGADLYACTKDCYSKIFARTDTGYVINNNDDYTKFIIRAGCLEVAEWPAVDFSKSTLLAGVIITSTTCCTTLRIDLTKDLSLPKYTLMVTLQPGPNSSPGAVFYWGVASKLPSDAEVLFMNKYYSIQ